MKLKKRGKIIKIDEAQTIHLPNNDRVSEISNFFLLQFKNLTVSFGGRKCAIYEDAMFYD